MKPATIHIRYGQYGIGSGMDDLAELLHPYGRVNMHQWYERKTIENLVTGFMCSYRNGIAIIIGYSLGGNCAPEYADGNCALTISYDPSIYSPLVHGYMQPVSSQIKKAVCYWNIANWFARGVYGGAKLVGSNVVTHQFSGFHLTAHARPDLHELSVNYVRQAVAD